MPKVVSGYKEKARTKILEAAVEEFMSKGYRNTTMDGIAKRVGVSKTAIYQYFPGKQSLLRAVATAVLEEAARNQPPSDSIRDPVEALRGSLGKGLGTLPTWFPAFLSDLVSVIKSDKAAKDLVRSLDTTAMNAGKGYWERQKAAGRISRDVDCEKLSRGLIGLQVGLTAMISTGVPRSQVVEAWEEVTRLMGEGLKRRS